MGMLERVAERDSDRDDVLIGQLARREQMIQGGAAYQL